MRTPNTLPIYIRHEIRQQLRTGIIWAIAFGIYVGLIVLIFPSFRDSGAFDAIDAYPEALRKAFGIEELTTINAFLNTEVYSYAPLVLAFLPIMAFAGAIAGAEERGALDILLGNPIPRRNIVLATWIAVALVLLGVLIVAGAVSWVASAAVGAGLDPRDAFRGALDVFPISLAFGSLALLLSTILRSRGAVIGISFAVMFLMYLIDIIGKIAPEYDAIRWVSAFRFYGQPITEGMSWTNVAVLLGATVALLIGAVAAFDRRDVYT